MSIFDKMLDVTSAVRLGLNIREHRNNRINTEYDRRIRIAFIVQDPGVWEMQRDTFQSLKDDRIFNLCVVVGNEAAVGFYRKECQGVKIFHGRSRKGTVIELKKYHFDYVFFDCQNDELLPKKLRSSEVSKYGKTCWIFKKREAMPSEMSGEAVLRASFLRNLYMVFTDSPEQAETVYGRMWKPCRLSHHVRQIGNTAGQDIIKYLLIDFSGGDYDCP